MTVAVAVENITEPIGVGTPQRFHVYVFSDARRRTKNTTLTVGNALRAVVSDPSGSTYSYACTASSYSLGRFYFDLTAGNHATAGDAGLQIHLDGVLKGRFSFEFVSYL